MKSNSRFWPGIKIKLCFINARFCRNIYFSRLKHDFSRLKHVTTLNFSSVYYSLDRVIIQPKDDIKENYFNYGMIIFANLELNMIQANIQGYPHMGKCDFSDDLHLLKSAGSFKCFRALSNVF